MSSLPVPKLCTAIGIAMSWWSTNTH
ncbi:hypothetical protein [Xanthomonas phage vB_XooS_NR08]|nr:hypothetical protein [Xanthomonas phage vB_XooS_NR08]